MCPQALNEEKVAYDRSPSKNIYLNVAVNTLKKLRGLVPSPTPGLNSKSGRGGQGVTSARSGSASSRGPRAPPTCWGCSPPGLWERWGGDPSRQLSAAPGAGGADGDESLRGTLVAGAGCRLSGLCRRWLGAVPSERPLLAVDHAP